MEGLTQVAPADMDVVYRGQAYGNFAAKLLANGMNPSRLRTNDVLRKDEWTLLDTALIEPSRIRMRGVNDLISRGLTFNIENGLGVTVLDYESISDFGDAAMNMDATAGQREDRLNIEISHLPLPIIHKGWRLSARHIEAARRNGFPIDTTQTSVAGIKLYEKADKILFRGASSYAFGGGTIYGYCDYTNRNTVSLGTGWDDSSVSGATILSKVLAMIQAAFNDMHYGPFVLYIPTAYETKFQDDFKANSDLTIQQRIEAIDVIEAVTVADQLAADNVVLVEMRPETVRMVIGMQPTNIEWAIEGGLITHYRSMMIMVPQIRSDQDGHCGIVHAS